MSATEQHSTAAVKRLPPPPVATASHMPMPTSPRNKARHFPEPPYSRISRVVEVPSVEEVWAGRSEKVSYENDEEGQTDKTRRPKLNIRDHIWVYLKAFGIILIVSRLANWFTASTFGGHLNVSEEIKPPETLHPSVPPLNETFVMNCMWLLTPEPTTYISRLGRLVDALHSSDASASSETSLAFIAEPGPSAEYFLGNLGPGIWSPSERPFLVAVTRGTDAYGLPQPNVTLLTPAFEESRARLIGLPEQLEDYITFLPWRESDSPYQTLLDYLGVDGFVLDEQVRQFVARGLQAAQGEGRAPPTEGVTKAVAGLRQHKEAREIELMRCANQFTIHAIRRTRERLYIGVTESRAREILYEEMATVGLSNYGALVLFGSNAALPHGRGSDRRLGKHDLVLIDAGGHWGGYISDITRTFPLYASEIPEVHKQVWEIVRRAQSSPAILIERELARGNHVTTGQLDEAARATVTAGMKKFGVAPQPKERGPDYTVLTHRLGHGIGLEGHEAPYCVQGPLGETVVEAGHAFTLEPGVYIPSESNVGERIVRGLGIRLEDVFVVHEQDGAVVGEFLTGPVKAFGDV